MLEAVVFEGQPKADGWQIDRDGREAEPAFFGAPRREGHRENLRRRLLDGGGEAFSDREILESLLITVIPRVDVKPLVGALLQRFGSLGGVFNASPRSLMAIPGIRGAVAAALRLPGVVAGLLSQTCVPEKPILSNWKALIDYVKVGAALADGEGLRALYLNTHNRLLLDRVIDAGVGENVFSIRDVIGNAMTLGAAALLFVRNVSDAQFEPEPVEVSFARKVAEAGRHLGIIVHDYILIGEKECVSLKSIGLI